LYFEDARQYTVDDEQFKDIIGDGYTKAIRIMSLDTKGFLMGRMGYANWTLSS
jgi:hypothetical protein